MHRINDAIVHHGKIILADLPFAEGQHVQILLTPSVSEAKVPIEELRRQMKGTVEYRDDLSEPMIPLEDWEMLK